MVELSLDRWPCDRFSAVPPLSVATELAESVLRLVFPSDPEVAARSRDLHEICKRGGFVAKRLDRRFSSSSHDALLVPQVDGRFAILVDPVPKCESSLGNDLARHRNRFRIAHELGHSFFYDRSARPAKRLVPFAPEEETFCDEFASSLLVPRSAILNLPATPSSVFTISRQFDVSVEMAARSLARTHPDASIAGLLWGQHPSKPKRPNLRITWFTGPRFMPRHAALHSSTVSQAAIEGEAFGVEQLDSAALRGRFLVQAARLPKRKQMVVVLSPTSEMTEAPDKRSQLQSLPLSFSQGG